VTTIEVNIHSPRFGEVRICDVRVFFGPLRPGMQVTAMALAPAGGGPSVARLVLMAMGGARGGRCGFACPQCERPRALLVVDGEGGLACRPCTRERTRRQSERTCREWLRLGGELTDRLVRALLKPRRSTHAVLERARELAGELVAGDEDRLAAIMPLVAAASELADAAS
jgi:hypothetical protein